jgi:L,D-peptidoglycan transpeptidase YkuD (ErfK/YbiS/YcfS/YnhG family)
MRKRRRKSRAISPSYPAKYCPVTRFGPRTATIGVAAGGRRTGRGRPPTVWTVRRRPGRRLHHGLLDTGTAVFTCVLGRAGISACKREGDGATPRGRLKVLGGYRRRDRLPLGRRYRGLKAIDAHEGWCDDQHHPAYNRPVRLPLSRSHESMRRNDRLYDICLVLDWNVMPRARWRGSAIFFHLARADLGPTEGCIAVEPAIMDALLRRIHSRTVIRVLA